MCVCVRGRGGEIVPQRAHMNQQRPKTANSIATSVNATMQCYDAWSPLT